MFDFTYQKIINKNKKELVHYKNIRNDVALKKYYKNKKTLDYLNFNPLISEKSGWQKIKKMKYIDLLNAYFNSDEFVQTINELHKKENKNYINQYIFFAKTYVTFFKSYQANSTQKSNDESNSSIPFETNYSNEISLSLYQSSNNDNVEQNVWLMLIIVWVWNINEFILFICFSWYKINISKLIKIVVKILIILIDFIRLY